VNFAQILIKHSNYYYGYSIMWLFRLFNNILLQEGDYEKITTNWYGSIKEREAENTDEMISFYSKDEINLLPRVVQRIGRTNFAKINNV